MPVWMKTTLRLVALAFVLFMAFIIYRADTGTMPGIIRTIYAFPNGDRVGHFVLYAVFTLLVNASMLRIIKIGKANLMLGSLIIAAFGTLEEFSQLFFAAHRTFDLIDLSCTLLGVMLADVTVRILKPDSGSSSVVK